MSDTGFATTVSHPPSGPLRLEDVLSRYEILGEVGKGGMGVVYKARHRQLERSVAIKVCLPGGHLDRFQREARLLAQVKSPHVVPVHDFERLADGRAVLVMEWIDGKDLGKVMAGRNGSVPEAEAVPWMAQVCEGMQAAEEQRIVHRDLKPSNILIDARTGQALVADFGLASAPTVDQLSVTGQVMGTPYYMAPEQAEDPRGVDTRADVYSFGATFYHVLTGRPPFDGPSHFTVLFKHKTEPLVAPKSLKPELTDRTAELIERCLAKSPAARFGSFAELRAVLAAKGGASPWDPTDEPRLAPYLKRYDERRGYYLGMTPTPGAGPDVYTFPDGRRLLIGFGDLTRHRVTAVVNSVAMWMRMETGVSLAIRRIGGREVEEAALRFAPVRAGRVVVTTAGNLPARFVFHGVTIGLIGEAVVYPTRDLITELIDGCFYHADTLDVPSLAFPVFGTGGAGGAPEGCLDGMFLALTKKLFHGLTSVREARVVIFPPHIPASQFALSGEWL